RGRRVEEEGGSEGRPVAGRIGVEPSGEITPRESGPTSLWCLRTRPSEQLAWETEQMTAACLLVRSPACSARQLQTSIVQVVHLCPTGFRKEPCERLERHKPKGLRIVLRGLGSSNAPRLPGGGGGDVTSLPDPSTSPVPPRTVAAVGVTARPPRAISRGSWSRRRRGYAIVWP